MTKTHLAIALMVLWLIRVILIAGDFKFLKEDKGLYVLDGKVYSKNIPMRKATSSFCPLEK